MAPSGHARPLMGVGGHTQPSDAAEDAKMGPVNRDSVMVESPFESFEQSKFGRAEPPSLAARALNNKWRVGLLLAFPALVITAVAAAGVSSSGHGGNALCAPTCFEEGTHDSDGDGYHEAHCDDDCNDEQQAVRPSLSPPPDTAVACP